MKLCNKETEPLNSVSTCTVPKLLKVSCHDLHSYMYQFQSSLFCYGIFLISKVRKQYPELNFFSDTA